MWDSFFMQLFLCDFVEKNILNRFPVLTKNLNTLFYTLLH